MQVLSLHLGCEIIIFIILPIHQLESLYIEASKYSSQEHERNTLG